jgi:hypothetical protein
MVRLVHEAANVRTGPRRDGQIAKSVREGAMACLLRRRLGECPAASIVGTIEDVTERAGAEEKTRLLMREVNHRACG